MLTITEMEQIARLTQEPGYHLLLDALQAQVDDIAEELDKSNGGKEELRLLSLWKAARRTLAVLKYHPQYLFDELYRQNIDLPDPEDDNITNYLPKNGMYTPPPFPEPYPDLEVEDNTE